MNDEQLIREYCLRDSQEAFAELVRRYAGLVYGTACRHAGDAFVAEEICQEAFCALARQIGAIRKPAQLPAWLYQTTRRLAAMHVRGDQRRVARERLAALMNSTDTDAGPAWQGVEPLLDEALENLEEQDRTAILGRFFRGLSMAEVAEGLGVSEAAAKMRVGRAVEKLRTFFSQHGAACSTAALLLLLERNAAAQPPASVIGSALGQVAKSGVRPQSAAALSKTAPCSRVALPVALGVVLLGLMWFVHERSFAARRLAGTLPGEETGAAPILASASVRTNTVKALPAGDHLRLTVLDATSSAPLGGVKVSATTIRPIGEPLGEAVTDVDGHCEVPRPAPAAGDFSYSLRAEREGYTTMTASWSRFQRDDIADIPDDYELKMPPGTRIGGIVTDEDGRALAGIQVKLQGAVFQSGPPPRQRARLNGGGSEVTLTNPDGQWTWDRMPPDWEDIRLVFAGQEFLPATYVCDANRHPHNGQVPIAKEDLLAGRARIQLKRGLLLTGRVLDPNRRPLAGVRVVQNFNWHDDYDGKENVVTLEPPEETGIRIQGEVYEDASGAPIQVFEVLVSEGSQGSQVSKEGRDGKFTVRPHSPPGSSGGASIAIRAEGYEPAESRSVPATNGDCTLVFRLRRSNGWSGVVLLPDGQPAAKAEVALSSHLGGPILGRRQLLFRDQCVFRLTGEDGRFHFDSLDAVSPQRGVLPAQRQYGHDIARLIVAVHPQGYAERAPEKLDQLPVLRLQPWGRIEGLLRSSRGPVAQREICISKRSCLPWVNSVLLSPMVFMTTTDGDGRFVFEDVPPGEHALGCHFPGGSGETRLTVQVKAGETSRVEMGGNGSTLTGKLFVPEYQSGFDFSHSAGHLQRVQAKPADLPRTVRRIDFTSDEAYTQAERSEGTKIIAWWQSPEGLAAWREARTYAVWFDADGTLHAEDVPPGEYDLTVFLQVPTEQRGVPPRTAGIYKVRLVVPNGGNSKTGEPVNLGTIDLDK
jgi:RNA polymerase sigma factor (sigma-70 family)